MGSSAELGSSSRSTSGLTAKGACDTEPLLLAARERVSGFVQLILYLFP